MQVAPTVCAVEFAIRAVQPFGTEGFVEAVGRIGRITEEKHRRDATFKKTLSYVAQQKATQPLTVKPPQHVDLVQFTSESGHTTIMWRPFGESDQLATPRLDNHAEPTVAAKLERFAPLLRTKLDRWP